MNIKGEIEFTIKHYIYEASIGWLFWANRGKKDNYGIYTDKAILEETKCVKSYDVIHARHLRSFNVEGKVNSDCYPIFVKTGDNEILDKLGFTRKISIWELMDI